VQGKLFGSEYVFARRPWIILLVVRFIEGVDRQRSLDFDRFFSLFSIEHQPAAETANRLRLIGAVENGVFPHRHDFHGHPRLIFTVEPLRLFAAPLAAARD
jgi:hypothetical protein